MVGFSNSETLIWILDLKIVGNITMAFPGVVELKNIV
jgi:hypothetical protein